MPRKTYKKAGNDVISFMKKVGSNYELKSREIRTLYRDEKGDLYIRNYGNTRKPYSRVRYSKNKKVGLYVVK